MIRLSLSMLALVILAAAQPALADGDPVEGKAVFKKCAACHNIGPGATSKIGPPLNGIVGRKAGTWPGYNYSDANLNSGITWDEAALTAYLKSPKTMVPGTAMAFAGLKKDEDIANVIAYLKTFDLEGNPVAP